MRNRQIILIARYCMKQQCMNDSWPPVTRCSVLITLATAYAYLHLLIVGTSLRQIQPTEDRAHNISHMYMLSSRCIQVEQISSIKSGMELVVPFGIYLVEMCNGQCRCGHFDIFKINESRCFEVWPGHGHGHACGVTLQLTLSNL